MAYLEKLDESDIFILNKKLSKESALKAMARKSSKKVSGVSAGDILKKLLEREESASTGMGNGLAIPHSRLSGLKNPLIFLFISPDGILFNALDAKPVKVFFLVLSPQERSDAHLAVLNEIAMKAANSSFLDLLINQKNISEIKQILSAPL